MIHQYKSNGYNIVMDVESGAVHVVDDVTYDVIALFEDTEISKIASPPDNRGRDWHSRQHKPRLPE